MQTPVTQPLFEHRRLPGARHASLTVDASVAGDPVAPGLFGNFLEHLGFAIDGGLSAQLLSNPTFTLPSNLSAAQKAELLNAGRILEAYAKGAPLPEGWVPGPGCTGFGVTALDDWEAEGLPFPWAPLGASRDGRRQADPSGEASRAEVFPRTTGGIIGHGVRLRAVPQGRRGLVSGISQGVFLPLHRQRVYTGTLWARIAPAPGRAAAGGRSEAKAGPDSWSDPRASAAVAGLRVGFRRRSAAAGGGSDGEVLVSTLTGPVSRRWEPLHFSLRIPEIWAQPTPQPPAQSPGEGISPCPALHVFEPLDFFISWEGSWDVAIDQVALFPADHIDGLDPEVLEAIVRWPVPVLRWPGGNFVSGYHWRDGVGPLHLRPTRPNRAWGGLDYNRFGTDEFMALCRRIGAQPQITVNTGTGSPEEAAAWVEYCNGSLDTAMGRLRAEQGHPEPYNVKVWEIGNEVYAEWQEGFFGAEENARRYEAFARAMRAVDPSITLIGCGNCFDFVEPGPGLDFTSADGGLWHRALLAAEPTPDMVSLHAIPDNERALEGLDDRQAYYSLMSHTTAWEQVHLPTLEALARQVAGAEVRPAITEWGVLGPIARRPRVENYGGCLYAGLFLHMGIRLGRRLPLANATALLHGGCLRKAGGRVYADPQYLVLQRYATLVGARPVRCLVECDGYAVGPGCEIPRHPDTGAPVADVPYVDAVACLLPESPAREAGHVAKPAALIVCAVNRHLDQAIPLRVRVTGPGGGEGPANGRFDSDMSSTAEATFLSGPSVDAVASLSNPERFAWRPITVAREAMEPGTYRVVLPPMSITWLTIAGVQI